MKEKITEEVVEHYIDYFKLHNSCECKCCRWWKRRFDILAEPAISKTSKAIFDEELFKKKFTKTERESLEKKYGVE